MTSQSALQCMTKMQLKKHSAISPALTNREITHCPLSPHLCSLNCLESYTQVLLIFYCQSYTNKQKLSNTFLQNIKKKKKNLNSKGKELRIHLLKLQD